MQKVTMIMIMVAILFADCDSLIVPGAMLFGAVVMFIAEKIVEVTDEETDR